MTAIQSAFINTLRAYIHNETITLPNGTDYEALFELSKIHGVAGIVAAMNRKCRFPMSNELAQKFDVYMIGAVTQSVTWDRLYKEVSGTLAENKVRNIVVKGPIVKKYYPDPDLRTMGDIDLVIHRDDMPAAHKVMKDLGFKICESSVDEYKFERKNLCVELHEDLTSKDFGTGIDYKKEMQYIFNCVKNPNEYIQELTDECHLVYLVMHIADHLLVRGCGIRQLLDIAITLKTIKIDFSEFWNKINQLRLFELTSSIMYLINKMFGLEIYIPKFDLEENLINALLEYIISGGVFGYDANRMDNNILRNKIKYNNNFKFIFSVIFPPVKELRAKVPWFRNKTVLLVPVAWINRYWNLCTRDTSRLPKFIKLFFKNNNKTVQNEYEMLKKLGFYKNI